MVNRYNVVLDNGLVASNADIRVNWKNAKIEECSEILTFQGEFVGKVYHIRVSDYGQLVGILEIDEKLLKDAWELTPAVQIEYDLPKRDILENVRVLQIGLSFNHIDDNMLNIRQQISKRDIMDFSKDIILPTIMEEDIIRTEPIKINGNFEDKDAFPYSGLLGLFIIIVLILILFFIRFKDSILGI